MFALGIITAICFVLGFVLFVTGLHEHDRKLGGWIASLGGVFIGVGVYLMITGIVLNDEFDRYYIDADKCKAHVEGRHATGDQECIVVYKVVDKYN
jgi:hypothetical protein